jgi:hypothetical protein
MSAPVAKRFPASSCLGKEVLNTLVGDQHKTFPRSEFGVLYQ